MFTLTTLPTPTSMTSSVPTMMLMTSSFPSVKASLFPWADSTSFPKKPFK